MQIKLSSLRFGVFIKNGPAKESRKERTDTKI